jgi:CRP-like cAMP-binding protein/Fe-S-cluster-containing hydrogenase component 2
MSESKSPSMVHLNLDGEKILVPAGTSILEVAWKRKIDIPVLCHEQDKNPVGVCRMCVVDVGGRAFAAACMLKAEVNEFKKNPGDPDWVIKTNTKEVLAARNTMLQLLMSEHPQHCVTSEHRQECELEMLVERLGVPETPYARRLPGVTRGQDKSSPSICVDHDSCILCDRCVRACADEEHFIIARQGKGHAAQIAFGFGKPMHSSGCVSCGACVIACPTGAITSNVHSSADRHPDGNSRTNAAFDKVIAPVPAPGSYSSQSHRLLQRGTPCETDELLKFEIFKHVSRKFLKQNFGCVVRRTIPAGEVLYREGERGETAFYIINPEGKVNLSTRPVPGKPLKRSPAQLGYGDLVGEMSCINLYPRLETATAATDCEVLEMLRNMLEMVRNYTFRGELERQYRQRALDILIDDDQLFASLTTEFVETLRENARLVRYEQGDIIFKEGDPPDAFYLVSLGFVRISRAYRGGDFVLKYIGPGSHFGEMSLINGTARSATCTALHHVELIRIDGKHFQEMIELFPHIRGELQSQNERHTRENHEQWLELGHHAVEKAEMGLEEAESMLVLDLDKCTRCDQCVIACEQTHQGTTRLIRDGLRVDHYLVASACRHCHDPLCMVCHWDAITRDHNDESRAVIIHKDKCVGCGQCAVNCPYGNIKLIDANGSLVPFDSLHDGSKRAEVEARATSCDLCPGYEVPNCVYACPHDAAHRYSAAEFRDQREQESLKRRKRFAP